MNQWIKKIKKKITKYLENNENTKAMVQNLWGSATAVLRGKFIVIQASLKKQEKYQNNLTLLQKNKQGQSQQKEGNNKEQSGHR